MWHKSQLLFPINAPSPVHLNKGVLTHFLASAAGLCFTAYVLTLTWTKRPGSRDETRQIDGGSPALSGGRPGRAGAAAMAPPDGGGRRATRAPPCPRRHSARGTGQMSA